MAPPAQALIDMLGENLLVTDAGAKTTKKTADHLDGVDAVGIYFSAHWCPPCRGFTPKLAESYNKMVAAGKKFEIVFASSDRDAGSFEEYFAEQPWAAVPYDKRDVKDALSKKFKVRGIPTFVIVDAATGETITTDGRSAVMSDPEGDNFPWRPPPFSDVIGDSFLRGSETVGKEAVEGKYLGIYFSAHWCPPCKMFTPELAKTYLKLKEKRDDFEFIFSSGDQDQAMFDGYYGEQPDWLAIPFEDEKRRKALDEHFAVEGIPTFVIVDPEGKVVNASGRAAVSEDPEGNDFPWVPPAVAPISAAGEFINEETTLIALLGSLDDAGQEAASVALTAVAEMTIQDAKANGKEPELRFAVSKSYEGITEQIVKLTKVETDRPRLVMLDIPDNGGFYVSEAADINEDEITKFIANRGERKQLGN